MASLTDNNAEPNSDGQPNKRRRKKSIVWDYFTIENISSDCKRACCMQCKKSFAYTSGSKLAGTSHLKRHIALGICPVSRQTQEKNQLIPHTADIKTNGSGDATGRPRKHHRATNGHAQISFDHELCSYEIAKMIIQHDYPLHMVEHSGFVDFAKALHPQYDSVNLNTIQEYILRIYLNEKQNLLSILAGTPGRIGITLDFQVSDQSLGFVILRGQFVDCDWKLHRRILNVIMLPFPDAEVAFNHAVVACLTDWSFETKLFTLTVNESFNSENVGGSLRGLLSVHNPAILNGQLIISNCYARVVSSVAQEALASMWETIENVRQSVKYVIFSVAHHEKFIELKQQLQVASTRSLDIDDLTKWNTTYEMLISASELKEVFSFLSAVDPDYHVAVSMDEWRQVETLCRFLKLFYDAASILTVEACPTANKFFHEVWKIQLELMHGTMSHDVFVSNLTKPLAENFNRYWKDCNLILAAAAVMDPRFKMKLIDFSFSRIYGEDAKTWIKFVDEGVHDLYADYHVQSLPPPTFVEETSESVLKAEISGEDGLLSTGDGLADFDIFLTEIDGGGQKYDLDVYLEEDLMPRVQDFDVLGWWSLNRLKYPILSKMALDILSIPFSTVPQDCVFDTSKRKMESYKSTLRPATIEALTCAKDWLQYGSSEFRTEMPSSFVKVEY